jgi:hypothetical protein
MITIDEAKKRFEQFKLRFESYKSVDISESDTRSKILDELFINILGWSEKDINRERYVQVGYYDYCFSIPNFKFVVEAKRNLKEFTLPVTSKNISCGTLFSNNKEVINQIRQYCFEANLQFGVISNGHQFIIGKFVNGDGSDWKNNKCIIFDGIQNIENRFIEFYNLLSKNAVVEHNGFQLNIENFEGQTLLSTIAGSDTELVM